MSILQISSNGYKNLAAQLAGPQVRWLADSFNQQWLHAVVGEAAMVQECAAPTDVHRLIAVGGCSVRDRCALLAHHWSVPWSFIPSVLSTDCIGVNRAVEYRDGLSHSVVVDPPSVVHLNYSLLRSGGSRALRWWCAAGVGDLLACISAAIHQAPAASAAEVLAAVPAATEALRWLSSTTPTWSNEELERLARLLLASSEEVTSAGSTALSAAGEHQLYYALRRRGLLDPNRQPHGFVVSIGTLMCVWAYSHTTQQTGLEERLRMAYRAVGLPTSRDQLRKHGIERTDVLAALASIPSDSFLGNSFRLFKEKLFDDCF